MGIGVGTIGSVSIASTRQIGGIDTIGVGVVSIGSTLGLGLSGPLAVVVATIGIGAVGTGTVVSIGSGIGDTISIGVIEEGGVSLSIS